MSRLQRICITFFPMVISILFACAGFSQEAERIKDLQQKQYKEAGIMMEPKEFLEVILNDNAPNKCTPKEPDDINWLGVLIQAPKKVSFNRAVRIGDFQAFAAIPICGYYRIDLSFPPDTSPITLVAKNIKTGKVYSGPLREPVYIGEPVVVKDPRFHPSKPEEGDAVGGHFNPNLADFVKLPEEAGTYEVHVEFRKYRSNTVTIEIVEEKTNKEEK